MADIRINALATTAASTASDDFVAVDGSANGTRKLNAYSPTFGGNLTVSGTGTSSFAGSLLQRSSTGVGAIASIGTDTLSYSVLRVQNTAASGRSFDIGTAGSGDATLGSKLYIYDSTAGATRWTMDSSGNIAQTGNLTVSGTGNSSVAGTLLVATTTNSSNGKLQLADHTTSAGGIGFGTDTSLFRTASGNLAVYGSGTDSRINFSHSTSTANKGFDVQLDTAKDAYVWQRENRSLFFGTNNTTALTLDSSQNATFAGNILLAAAKGMALNGQTNPAVHGISSSGNNLSVVANTGGVVNLGTASNGALFTVDGNGVIKTQGGTAVTPASASATGTAGMIQWDASYIYVCTAANTWKRVAIATWP